MANQLKKPMVVWIMGWGFILAAPRNMAIGLYLQHVPNWYSPELWFRYFTSQPPVTQIMILLLPVAGISLLVQRKSSWIFAILLLVFVCIQNLNSYFSGDSLVFPVAVPLLINGAIITIIAHFRYPYLDKRDRIWGGMSQRFDIEIPVHMDQLDGVVIGNISKNGCLLRIPLGQELPPVMSTIRIEFEGISFECLVLRHAEKGCAVRFLNPARLPKAEIRRIRGRFKKPTARAA